MLFLLSVCFRLSYQIRLQSLVFYFSLNVVFVAVVVCLFICLPRYCVAIVI